MTFLQKICTLILIYSVFESQIFAQNISKSEEAVSLEWNLNSKQISFKNCAINNSKNYLPIFTTVMENNGETVEFYISNPVFAVLDETKILEIQKSSIENDIITQIFSGKSGNKWVHTFTILPFRYHNGNLEILTSFVLHKKINTSVTNRLTTSSFSYPAHSILQSGKFYKIGVQKEGIYKLDYTFLKNMGIAVDQINPNTIRIFGHRAGMLPELAGAAHETDAQELPVKLVSASSTQFQNGDYLLVYLPGPESWTYNASSQFFSASKHLYSDTKFFYISTDNGTSQKISSINSSPLSPTQTFSMYTDYAFIENNNVNIAHSGRIFLGDEFGSTASRNYTFSFPNINTTFPLKVNIALASDATTFGSSFTLSLNGNLQSINMGNIAEPYPGIRNSAAYRQQLFMFAANSTSQQFSLNFERNGDFNTKGWLDFLQVNAVSDLRYNGAPLLFRNPSATGFGNISKFTVQNMNAAVEIWDITNPFDVKKINTNLSGNTADFAIATDSLKQFALVDNTAPTPQAFGVVSNQDLHSLGQQDMLIITRKNLMPQAEQIAQLHRSKQGLRVAVVDLIQIFNEFSSGTPDISAIRNFTKMFYDRAAGNTTAQPKYVLLFGDGTFDNKNIGDYLLPTYQSKSTFEALITYVSDDYYGCLDDFEGADITNTAVNIMDVAVGRIPVDNTEKADIAVAKIKSYYAKEAFGDWRNQSAFIADDEDYNLHFQDAEEIADAYAAQYKCTNMDKIYLDAFNQQSGTGGAKYPDVNATINRKFYTGSLLFNYVGHGGPLGLAQEGILSTVDIDKWDNPNRLPFFITATCEFTPFDDYALFSAGERVLLRPDGGAIGLLSTTRLVIASQNKLINRNFMQKMAEATANTSMTIGDITREAKKITTSTNEGNRKFALFGDPALCPAFPYNKCVVTMIDSVSVSLPNDTIKALSKIRINGEVHDRNDILLSTFNGVASVIVYDKPKDYYTLQNDPRSIATDFSLQKNMLYKGKTRVTNGKFEVVFLAPRDIDYNYGFGKISLYAHNDTTDACGYYDGIMIGGAYDTTIADNEGPEVDLFLNDDKFVYGGITDNNPLLFAKLYDENGINTSGTGIGHDITAVIDNDMRNVFTLNDFYETDLDATTKGTVKYPFENLATGRHTLKLTAWDILNNSGSGYTEFIVEKNAELALAHVLNYPNPFTTNTNFMFEHNKPGQDLTVKIEIFSVSGKIVKTILKNINTEGYRVNDISWDGKDDFGDKIGRGVYIYRITVKDESGKKTAQYQKLVVLN